MGDKDLENLISSIGQEEEAVAQKQAQIERLKQLIKKQKAELEEQEALIQDLRNKMTNMYDLPADVEELKRMIGEMRADINGKDQQLEMAYGQIAQLEAELKNTKMQIAPISQNLDTYISQVGELKAKIVELDSLLNFKEKEIQELKLKADSVQQNYDKLSQNANDSVKDTYAQITQLKTDLAERDSKISMLQKELESANSNLAHNKQYQDDLGKQIADLKQLINQKEIESGDIRSKVESSVKEELFLVKKDFAKKSSDMETKLLDKDLELKELRESAENATRNANEVKARMEELMVKHDQIKVDFSELESKVGPMEKELANLSQFKEKNENVAINLANLTKLFEKEPLFKCFNLVREVGEMNIDDLKNALGVPSVTTNKYIKEMVDSEIFEISENGKLKLKYRLPSQ